MRRMILPSVVLALAACCAAQSQPALPPPGATMPATRAVAPQVEADANAQTGPVSVTHHVLTVGPKTIRYTATAGYLRIRNAAGKDEADIFFVAYHKDGQDAASRPITFASNGGPGAASLWLHLGALGPKRAIMPQDGTIVPKSFELVDNEYTWLDFTDLVFIDPVGSGYSTAAAGVDPKTFYSVNGDMESVGEFIRLYVTRNGRWLSPKYLAGESYGATRSAALSSHLQDRYGMNLTGVVLVSAALNFQTLLSSASNDLAAELNVPSYTAVAWYHNRLAPDLQKDLPATLALAECWTTEQLAPALAMGDSLPTEKRKEILTAYCRFTGLSQDFVDRANLRVAAQEFAKQILADQKKMTGILDARIVGAAPDPVLSFTEYDESLFAVIGPFNATIQDYIRRDLGFSSDLRYEFLSNAAHAAWDWGGGGQGYVNTAQNLRAAMMKNPNLRVLGAIGYFDLATGSFGQEYSYSHLSLPADLRKNLKTVHYPAGHQIYTHIPSLKQFTADVTEFYAGK